MDTKTVVKYVSYAVGVVALVSLFSTAPVQVVALAVCAGVNILYVGRE